MVYGIVAFATAALSLAPAFASTAMDVTKVKWSAMPIVHFTLTPNYASGFGSVKATFGTQPAPTHGPDALQNNGAVDFGSVLGGTTYLYKYAAHVNVTTNDPMGFFVYAEGAADFFNTADSSTQPLNSTLYYLQSTSGSPPDPNTGFSAALPFYRTGSVVTGGSQFTAPTISYTTYPAPVATAMSANGDYYFDYQLRVPGAATRGLYYVWIVYTVVAR